jgi:hypothetical protein
MIVSSQGEWTMKPGERQKKKKKICALLFSMLLFLSLAPASFSKENDILARVNILEQIILSKEANTLEVKILLNRYTASNHFKMGEPNRIVIDFFETENITAPRQIDVNDFGIISISNSHRFFRDRKHHGSTSN